MKVYDLKSLNKRLDVGSALELVTPLHKVLVVGYEPMRSGYRSGWGDGSCRMAASCMSLAILGLQDGHSQHMRSCGRRLVIQLLIIMLFVTRLFQCSHQRGRMYDLLAYTPK